MQDASSGCAGENRLATVRTAGHGLASFRVEFDGGQGGQLDGLLQSPLVIKGIDPNVPLADQRLVEMETIGAARIGGDHVFAVLTGQGRVEQREIEGLPGRNIAADGFEGQLVAVDLQPKADIERFGAVNLLKS